MDEIANILNEHTKLLRQIVQHLELLTQGKHRVLTPAMFPHTTTSPGNDLNRPQTS